MEIVAFLIVIVQCEEYFSLSQKEKMNVEMFSFSMKGRIPLGDAAKGNSGCICGQVITDALRLVVLFSGERQLVS
jgi:hypothetical protein